MTETVRLPGTIVVSRATGKVTEIIYEDIPVEKARPVIQAMAQIGRKWIHEKEEHHHETMARTC